MAFTGQITSRTIGVRLSRALNRPSLMKAFIRPSATLKGGRFRLRQAAATRRIVATSEHWWEDEEEFDSVTDALNPKRLLIVSSPADAAAVATLLSSVRFVCGFFGPQEAALAEELWAGRGGPPLFLKIRQRNSLGSGASSLVDEFLAEVLQQNWRVDLDAGLGVEDPGFEAILVVCAPDVTSQLLERCCKGQSEQPLAGTLSAIHIEGTQAGEPAEWDKLRKRIAFIGQPAVPGKDLSMELATK